MYRFDKTRLDLAAFKADPHGAHGLHLQCVLAPDGGADRIRIGRSTGSSSTRTTSGGRSR